MNRREFVVAAASLALAPQAFARSLAEAQVGLVTADLESRLVAVALASGRILRYVPTFRIPAASSRSGASRSSPIPTSAR